MGGGVGGHEGGGAGADGHVGDDHQELGLGDQRRTVCSARTCRRKKGKRSRERLRVAGSGGKRATQCRRMLERALGLLLFSRWWVGLGSKAALRPMCTRSKPLAMRWAEVYGCGAGRGAGATVPRVYVTERLLSLQRPQPAPPLHTRHVLPAGRRETACGLVARGQQSRCRGVGWGRWNCLISKGVPTAGR